MPIGSGRPWHELLRRLGKTYKHRIPEIQEKFGDYVGKPIGDQTITLSGIVGVVSAAGMRGAAKWLKEPEDRQKYPGTTRMFHETNGLF